MKEANGTKTMKLTASGNREHMNNEQQPKDFRERAEDCADEWFLNEMLLYGGKTRRQYFIELFLQFASEVSAGKDAEIKSLKAKLVIAAAERDGITHNLLNVQQECIEATKRIAELEKEIETLKNSETLHNEYMKGFGAGYDEGLHDGMYK